MASRLRHATGRKKRLVNSLKRISLPSPAGPWSEASIAQCWAGLPDYPLPHLKSVSPQAVEHREVLQTTQVMESPQPPVPDRRVGDAMRCWSDIIVFIPMQHVWSESKYSYIE